MEQTSPQDASALFDLTGRVVVVTGASSGLGDRFARVLHDAGATVVAVARRAERLEALASEHERISTHPCDLSEPDQIDALIAETVAAHGHVDVVVNNAGTSDAALNTLEQDPAEFERVLAINLVGPYRLCKRAAEAMVAAEQPGVIVNVASILGLRGSPLAQQAGYAASKGGLVNLTRSLAAQWAPLGIRVNALAPGWFESEMTDDMFANERALGWAVRRTPMGRIGKTGELDGALLFLCSDASSFVTGQIVAVDGGWTAV